MSKKHKKYLLELFNVRGGGLKIFDEFVFRSLLNTVSVNISYFDYVPEHDGEEHAQAEPLLPALRRQLRLWHSGSS